MERFLLAASPRWSRNGGASWLGTNLMGWLLLWQKFMSPSSMFRARPWSCLGLLSSTKSKSIKYQSKPEDSQQGEGAIHLRPAPNEAVVDLGEDGAQLVRWLNDLKNGEVLETRKGQQLVLREGGEPRNVEMRHEVDGEGLERSDVVPEVLARLTNVLAVAVETQRLLIVFSEQKF
ncbi:hypothetical protein ColTof4_14172 [Colletotrichum tofieldiae]|nr:hypothetical protein ColTof3_02909 [Colletotrichum tofieldiae]GKT81749.1 hypothetical protein ColTof4_14172 [Colletotrichum tofieldiae]